MGNLITLTGLTLTLVQFTPVTYGIKGSYEIALTSACNREPNMNPIVVFIAIGTFLGLAFMPLVFTSRSGPFWRVNRIACSVLAILLIPSSYWNVGQVFLIVIWLGCAVIALFSRINMTTNKEHSEVDVEMVMERTFPKVSASEKIQNLERLAKLRSEGMISSEEFNIEKRNFLG
ncbi:MAG: hypothetical protein M3R08_08125 [Bacteroidota bacterium]|nr:hypothetical protein [Bacteroidota bacterium]